MDGLIDGMYLVKTNHPILASTYTPQTAQLSIAYNTKGKKMKTIYAARKTTSAQFNCSIHRTSAISIFTIRCVCMCLCYINALFSPFFFSVVLSQPTSPPTYQPIDRSINHNDVYHFMSFHFISCHACVLTSSFIHYITSPLSLSYPYSPLLTSPHSPHHNPFSPFPSHPPPHP
jgi:hypothetical protein